MLLLVGLMVPLWALAGPVVYKWVDKNGEVHYSGQPHPGAARVELGVLSVVSFKVPPEGKAIKPVARPKALPHYRIRILAPVNGATLRPADYRVRVKVSISPALRPGARLNYALDGKTVRIGAGATALTLTQVYRGTHILTVTVRGSKGQALGRAQSTFYVHRHSILFRRRRPGPPPVNGIRPERLP